MNLEHALAGLVGIGVAGFMFSVICERLGRNIP